jgi:ABC-type uncharacterized transport system substrate-binding protein
VKRRAFIAAVTGAASTLAFASAAQTPKIGFLRSTTEAPFRHLATAFRKGLKEVGFVEAANVAIEYRYADNRRERLPALVKELLQQEVSVIVGNSLAAEAAKAVTSTVPIVFVTSDDPVKRGLVESLARPGTNATGFTFFGGGQLGGKRLQLLAELVPTAAAIGFLMDPHWPAAIPDLADTQAAARALGRRLVVGKAGSPPEYERAILAILHAGAGALIVGGAPSFSTNRNALIQLSARHGLPTMYDLRDYVVEGGLVSYSASIADAYRQAGIYAGKILHGARPRDLPVQQPTRIELVLNLRTAKRLGLTPSPAVLARADEIIE